jgi:hypothetical protein
MNLVLRANRFVAVVLKPLRTLSTCGLCAPRALRFIPQNEFLSISSINQCLLQNLNGMADDEAYS